jgi:hypothetical protein
MEAVAAGMRMSQRAMPGVWNAQLRLQYTTCSLCCWLIIVRPLGVAAREPFRTLGMPVRSQG